MGVEGFYRTVDGVSQRLSDAILEIAFLSPAEKEAVSFRQACMTAAEGGQYRRCPTKRQRRTADEARITPSP